MTRLLALAALALTSTAAMAADFDEDPVLGADDAVLLGKSARSLDEALANRRPPPRHSNAQRRPARRPAPRAVPAPPPRVSVRAGVRVNVRPAPSRVVVRGAPPPRVVVRQAPPPRVVVAPPPRVVVRTPPPVHYRPSRTVVVRGAPPPRPVVVGPRMGSTTVVVHRARPWHGVFVYGPRPMYHDHYVTPAPQPVEEEHLPDRKVDREGSIAVGVRSGSYLSGYESGSTYGDFGLGLVGRWRPDEAVGLELAFAHHDETWNDQTERSQTLGQGSVMLFANPWGRVQPYVLGGLSVNERNIDDAMYTSRGTPTVRADDPLWGPHAGAGIEFAFGKRAALDLEARYVGWMNDREASLPGALQTGANFLVHF